MSVIDPKQGAIKSSEVAHNETLPVLGTAEREDLLTVVHQATAAVANTKRIQETLLMSTGNILWTGTQIQSIASADILIKFFSNEAGTVITVTIPSTLLPVALANGQIWALRVSRQRMASSFTANSGDFAILTEGTYPALTSPQSDASTDEFISTWIAAAYQLGADVNLYWRLHGLVWEPGKSALLGTVTSSATVPVGGIVDVHSFGSPIYGDAQVDAGYKVCDGTLVASPSSAFSNTTRDANGFPLNTFDPGLDRFAPDLVGNYTSSWSSAVSYAAGSKVVRNHVVGANNVGSRSSSGTTKAIRMFLTTDRIAIGETVTITNCGGAGYNGTYVVTNAFLDAGQQIIQYTGNASSTEGNIASPNIGEINARVSLASIPSVAMTANTNSPVMNSFVSPTWDVAVAYAAGDFVRYIAPSVNGSGQSFAAYYISLTAGNVGNTPFSSPANWQLVWSTDFGVGSPYYRVNPQASITPLAGDILSTPSRVPTFRRGSMTQALASAPSAYGGDPRHQLTEAQMPSHQHVFAQAFAAGQADNSSGGNPYGGNFAALTSPTGGNASHNNNPRYFDTTPIVRIF